ncbi:MAG: extracellular solute-binding protein [Ignavibacteriales bacterium]|nr:extracellular solute-binding protein [Ignavibacteriales bacterium]
MKIKLLFLSIVIISFFIGCSKKSNEVVVYTSVDQIFAEPVLQMFEKKTGIKVKPVYDTEETKSTGVLNRLIAEKDNPQCDIFWSGDPVRSIILKNKGITSGYLPNSAEGINRIFKDGKGYWIGFSSRVRVIIFNKNLVKQSEVPNSIYDLLNPKWKGKCAIANPLFGTTSFHIAALFTELGDDKANEFLNGLKQNDVLIATSNGDVKKRVADGEIAFGIVDTDDAITAMREGKPVGMIFPDQQGIGSLIVPNAVSLINNSPNSENGKILIDYLLSTEAEMQLAKLAAQIPMFKTDYQIPEMPVIQNINDIKSMNIDYEKAAAKLEEIQPLLKKWLEQ